jgi:uncharacterized protein (TIGR02246 family)
LENPTMRRRKTVLASLAALAFGGLSLLLFRSPPQPIQAAPADEPPARAEAPPDLAALRKMGEDYVAAFNKGDVKALVGFWMPDGEFAGADGVTVKGRDALEKAYTDFFKENPGAKLQIEIQSLRLVGRATALEEGLLRLTRPGQEEPEVTHYNAIHVREGDRWLTAQVREVDADPAELVSVKDLAWLVGEWSAKSEAAELKAVYEWAEGDKFLVCHFELTEKGKPALKGVQRIGRDPVAGALRSWVFESGGGFGEGVWERQGQRWVIEATGTLPDGSETTAINIILPLGPDLFTFQSIERTVAGVEVSDLPPIKVLRIKK